MSVRMPGEAAMQTQAGSVQASLQVIRLSRHEVARPVDAVALRRQMKAIATPAVHQVPRLRRA